MRVENLPDTLTQQRTQAPPKSTKDEFLRLLVAQLQYQNPLDPQEGAEFVAQLAQFTSLEQSQEMNTRLANLEAGQDTASRAALVGLTGRSVTAGASQIAYNPEDGPVPNLNLQLSKPASKVEIVINNADGVAVRHIDMSATNAGETALNWDGKDDNGQDVVAGNYNISVDARDQAGATVPGGIILRGQITAVAFQQGGAAFQVGSVTIAPSDIASLDGETSTTPVVPTTPQPTL